MLGSDGTNGSIVVFERAANGILTFRSCLNEAGTLGCGNGRGVSTLQSGSITPDGQVLAAKNQRGGGQGGISFFDINGSTGALSQRAGAAGCITNDGSVPDGAGGVDRRSVHGTRCARR